MVKSQFRFSIRGPGVQPDTVRLRDLTEVLSLLEATLAHTAKAFGASDKDDLSISLTEISPGSTDCVVATSDPMFRAATVVTKAVADDNFADIPLAGQSGLRGIWKKGASNGWDFSIIPVGNGVNEAHISHDHEILRPGQISGRTTLYGRCIHTGGEKPTVRLRLLDGTFFTAELRSKEMAQELGQRLYKMVGLDGEAKWSAEEWKLERFRATAITDYQGTEDTVAAFANLSEAAGDVWDGVDAQGYVQDLRAD